MRIAAFAPLVLLACRPEAPPRTTADEEAAASARMLALCKGGHDDACDRLGIARKEKPAATASTSPLAQSAWSVDPTPPTPAEAVAPVAAEPIAPVAPVAVDPAPPEPPTAIADALVPMEWVCWAARSPSGLHVGGCGVTPEECEARLASASDDLIDTMIHFCSPQKKAACFKARDVLDERDMQMCFPGFEACETTRRVAAKMTRTGDYKNVSKKCRSTAPTSGEQKP